MTSAAPSAGNARPNGATRTVGTSAGASRSGRAGAPATVRGAAGARRARKRTAYRETILTTSLIAFALACAMLGVFRVAGTMRESRSREALTASLVKVATLQDSYRKINARFATWPELASRGATLPVKQAVRRSSADASHWYVSLRDRQTGVVCDRIGELMDEPGTIRLAKCRVPLRKPPVTRTASIF